MNNNEIIEIKILISNNNQLFKDVKNNQRIKYIFGTLQDIEIIKEEIKDIDYIIHCNGIYLFF